MTFLKALLISIKRKKKCKVIDIEYLRVAEPVFYSNYCFHAQKGLINSTHLVYFQKKYGHSYCLFWGIYDVRLSLTLNSELLRYKNSLIDSTK